MTPLPVPSKNIMSTDDSELRTKTIFYSILKLQNYFKSRYHLSIIKTFGIRETSVTV